MHSTMNDAAGYSMVPRAMLGDLNPAPFRQWAQLERHAGKRDYVTATTKDLAQVWNGVTDRAARKALCGLEESGWLVVDDRTGNARQMRLWPSWYPVSDRGEFLANAEQRTAQRRAGEWVTDGRAISFREVAMTRPGTAHPYIHVPTAVLDQTGSAGDFLVWVALRSFLGPQGISAAAGTVGERAGLTREAVTRSTKRLVSSGLLLPTERNGRSGTKVYTVPDMLTGKTRAGKENPPVLMSQAA